MTKHATPVDESSRVNFPHNEFVELPRPTAQFRRLAWREFQRALDPLAPPKRLRFLPRLRLR